MITRAQPRIHQTPARPRRPTCPRWRSPPSFVGRWTDAEAGSFGRCRRVRGVAVFFGLSGRWPWHRLSSPPVPPAACTPGASRLHRDPGHSARRGDSFRSVCPAQHRRFDFQRLDSRSLLNPRRLRAGLVFSFRPPLGDSAPSHISVRTSPEQRVTFTRVSNGWDANASPSGGKPRKPASKG